MAQGQEMEALFFSNWYDCAKAEHCNTACFTRHVQYKFFEGINKITVLLSLSFLGVFLHYLLLQINLWWVLHMATLFWKVYFPVHARSLQSTRHLKVVHALCIIAALFLPLISVAAPIIGNAVTEAQTDQPVPGTHGFGFALFPPILCSGTNENVTFYTVILPNVLLILVGTITLVLAIWKIHKVLLYMQS